MLYSSIEISKWLKSKMGHLFLNEIFSFSVISTQFIKYEMHYERIFEKIKRIRRETSATCTIISNRNQFSP